ncbi:hypothetical protein PRIPAC_81976 [Pristionchus pacificus]|uniref:Uncharacterized protein n=1 Tax=Pristionchus pacificus TaxID=54126 RepID=A0A2A6CMR5_PRIPA|nr:hypothetical protein PRIPAC_81976 [Pristionchus pacificus]|eukprot:PDM79396.1 hypothetical protein PRIPAC_31975 [Pristionchus pacificus]
MPTGVERILCGSFADRCGTPVGVNFTSPVWSSSLSAPSRSLGQAPFYAVAWPSQSLSSVSSCGPRFGRRIVYLREANYPPNTVDESTGQPTLSVPAVLNVQTRGACNF